ncbi:MAG: 4Fe-4S binding protein, partial [Dehalococcoidia bacterium]
MDGRAAKCQPVDLKCRYNAGAVRGRLDSPNMWQRRFLYLAVALTGTVGPTVLEWASTPPPRERSVHVETFRYGTSPAILRANRGDRLKLSFSTRDTAHSFLLQSYRVEVKISPATDGVEVIDPLHPAAPSGKVGELVLIAGQPGLFGGLASVSRFRCHTYCGPMHGFEYGDLIVRPNYLLSASLGALASIMLIGLLRVRDVAEGRPRASPGGLNLNRRWPWVGAVLSWRPLQFVTMLPVMAGFTLIVLTGLIGTKVGGRNFAVMMTWVVWMGFLGIVLAPLSTRLWCLVCPLPSLGEFLQRRALTGVRPAESSNRFGNRFFGLGWRWPRRLRGPWIRMIVFVLLGSFSASLAGRPRWTAYLLLALAGTAFACSVIWELRTFCRYLCPAAAFISLYSAAGRLVVRNHDTETCDDCRDKACLKGNADGWACPYGRYLPGAHDGSECGICTECFKSCPHDNINLSWQRPSTST